MPRSGSRARSSCSSTTRCHGRSGTASPRGRDRPRHRGGCAAVRTRGHRPGRHRASDRRHVAGLVPDGATLQLGIGAIPAATAAALGGHRDLGIHTEMFTDPVVDLVEAGVVTGRPQGAEPRQDRDVVPDGLRAALRLRPRQPDGRDALGRLHQRHARHPVVPPHDRDQLGHRGRPHRARWSPTRSVRGSTAAWAGRWTSSGVRRSHPRAERSLPCRRPPAMDRSPGSPPCSPRARGW